MKKQNHYDNVPRSVLYGHRFGSATNMEDWLNMVQEARDLDEKIQTETDFSKRNAMTIRKMYRVKRVLYMVFDGCKTWHTNKWQTSIKKEMHEFLEVFCSDMGYDFKEMRKKWLNSVNADED